METYDDIFLVVFIVFIFFVVLLIIVIAGAIFILFFVILGVPVCWRLVVLVGSMARGGLCVITVVVYFGLWVEVVVLRLGAAPVVIARHGGH